MYRVSCRNSTMVRVAIALSAAAVLSLSGLWAQPASKADAEYLLKAFDTYRAMVESSPYKGIPLAVPSVPPTSAAGRRTSQWRIAKALAASTLPMRRVASGRRTTRAPRGSRCSRTTPPPASVTLRLLPPIRTSCGSEPARPICSARRWRVSASTRAQTPARRSPIQGSPTRTPSHASSFTRPTPMWSSWPPPDMRGRTTRCVGSSRRPMEARPGRKSFSEATAQAL